MAVIGNIENFLETNFFNNTLRPHHRNYRNTSWCSVCEINIDGNKLKITSVALSCFFQIKKYLVLPSLSVVPLKQWCCDLNEIGKQLKLSELDHCRACVTPHTPLQWKWNRGYGTKILLPNLSLLTTVILLLIESKVYLQLPYFSSYYILTADVSLQS